MEKLGKNACVGGRLITGKFKVGLGVNLGGGGGGSP